MIITLINDFFRELFKNAQNQNRSQQVVKLYSKEHVYGMLGPIKAILVSSKIIFLLISCVSETFDTTREYLKLSREYRVHLDAANFKIM